jgi:putative efflux protein, MATE family
MTAYVHDMTKGNVTAHLIRFAIPMLLGNLFQQFYNIVDSIVVGKYVGDIALAAVGIVATLNFLFFSICMGLSVGIGIVISHYFGAGKEDDIKKVIGNAIYITAAIGILMSVIGVVFARQILVSLDTPVEVLPYAVEYMQVLSAGVVFVAGYNGISAVLRALGDSKTPLIFLAISSVTNILLDVLFIIIMDMGAAGLGLATVISQAISMVGSIVFAMRVNPYLRLKKKHFAVDKEIIGKSLRLGIPMGIQYSLIAISVLALQKVVNGFGAVTMAAFTATSRIEQLINQPFSSLGAAISTFAGQNMGQENVDRVRSGVRKSVKIVLIFSIVSCIIFYISGEWIMGCFINNPEAIVLGARALRITSLFYIALGLIHVLRGMLNGAGDAPYALVAGLMEVIGRVVFSLILVRIPSIGVWGLWLTTGMTWTITAISGVWRYLQGKWTKIQIE